MKQTKVKTIKELKLTEVKPIELWAMIDSKGKIIGLDKSMPMISPYFSQVASFKAEYPKYLFTRVLITPSPRTKNKRK